MPRGKDAGWYHTTKGYLSLARWSLNPCELLSIPLWFPCKSETRLAHCFRKYLIPDIGANLSLYLIHPLSHLLVSSCIDPVQSAFASSTLLYSTTTNQPLVYHWTTSWEAKMGSTKLPRRLQGTNSPTLIHAQHGIQKIIGLLTRMLLQSCPCSSVVLQAYRDILYSLCNDTRRHNRPWKAGL